MAKNKACVVTDALSPKYYFPIWYNYYARHVGTKNIYIVTYSGCASSFASFPCGGLIELPSNYNDDIRRDVISSLVSTLLEYNEIVLRADSDEFLVPFAEASTSLREYIDKFDKPYITAIGLDVFHRSGEPNLNMDEPILVSQRRFAYYNSWLNKTCMTRIPLRWDSGFHWCTVFPRMDTLFIFHLKRADISQQLEWTNFVAPQVSTEHLRTYYDPDREKVIGFHRGVDKWPIVAPAENIVPKDILSQWVSKVFYFQPKNFYAAVNEQSRFLIELPDTLRGVF